MIRINGNEILKQPTSYNDDPETIKTDSFAIDGTIERQKYPDKKRVKLSYDRATPELVRYFKDLENQAQITFENNESVWGLLSFTGLITDFSVSEYRRGGDLLTELDVTIREF